MATQIQSQDLEGWVVAPGNYKYYGTDWVWTEWFQDLDTAVAALGFSTWAISQTRTLVAWETINAGDAVCQTVNTYQYTTSSAVVKTDTISTAPGQYKFWQALNIATDWYLKSFECKLNGNGDINITNITCEIYAMTWALGTTWAPTGAVLYSTKPVLRWASRGSNVGTPSDLYFTFRDEYIPAGDYCVIVDLTIVDNDWWSVETLEVLWWNPWWASGNFINWVSPVAGTDMYYVLKVNSTVLQADADVSTRRNLLGIAVTGATIGNNISVQTEWLVNVSWLTAWSTYYLSWTPWQLTTVNNSYAVGYCQSTDYIRLSPTMAGDQIIKPANTYFYATTTSIVTSAANKWGATRADIQIYEWDYDWFGLSNMTLLAWSTAGSWSENSPTALLKKGKWYYCDVWSAGAYAAMILKPIFVYI